MGGDELFVTPYLSAVKVEVMGGGELFVTPYLSAEKVEVMGRGELFVTLYLSAEKVKVLGGGCGVGHQHVDIVSVYFHFTAVTHLQQKHMESQHWLYKLLYVCSIGQAKLWLLLKTWI